MRYLSVCSGIEAATVAWHPLGWEAIGFSEIETFPCAVLRHHYPDVPNYGDLTAFQSWPELAVDLVVGGTPCQAFSVAGLRKGLGDPRGNLTLTFLGVVDRYRPRWVVWENVPGALSSLSHDAPDPCPPPPPVDLGRDGAEVETEDEYSTEELHALNCFLAGLSELGYGWSYRILDAQYAGVPQRRRRIFVVGHLGDWRRAVAVLSERHSLSGHSPPSHETGEGTPDSVARCLRGRSNATHREDSDNYVANVLTARDGKGADPSRSVGNDVAHALNADGFDASEDGTGRGVPLVVGSVTANGDAHSGFKDERGLIPSVVFEPRYYTRDNRTGGAPSSVSGALLSGKKNGDSTPVALAFDWKQGGDRTSSMRATEGVTGTLGATREPAVAFSNRGTDTAGAAERLRSASHGALPMAATGMAVRRLTPTECERLQGFPDSYTLIPYRGRLAADGPRYKALGNSMAVPVMRWIGERIAAVSAFPSASHPPAPAPTGRDR